MDSLVGICRKKLYHTQITACCQSLRKLCGDRGLALNSKLKAFFEIFRECNVGFLTIA